MRQDADVARMAAALGAPALRYRSFGNEPVRNAPEAADPGEDQAFSILGDALAGASDLPPDVVLGESGPRGDTGWSREQPSAPRPSLARDNYPGAGKAAAPEPATDARAYAFPSQREAVPTHESHAAPEPAYRAAQPVHGRPAQDPPVHHHDAPAQPRHAPAFAPPRRDEQPRDPWPHASFAAPDAEAVPATAPAMPLASIPVAAAAQPPSYPAAPVPAAWASTPQARHERDTDAEGASLLQLLLGGVPPAGPNGAPSIAGPAHALPIDAVPDAPALPPIIAALAGRPAAAPVMPQPVLRPVASLQAAAPRTGAARSVSAVAGPSGIPPAWSSHRYGSGSGSSLLDTLFGAEAGAANIHYPLLDALGDAMRGTPAEPSPRQWPAARVDIALPELLRRIAAGVRVARSAA